MGVKTLSHRGLERLIRDLKAIIEKGRKEALEAAKRPLVRMYWRLGERISREDAWEGSTLREVARRLHFEESLLCRVVEFYRAWPKSCPTEQTGQTLGWGHFKYLLPLKDKKERNFYLKAAIKEQWSRNLLAQRIKSNYYRQIESKKPGGRTSPVRLKRKPDSLYLYAGKVEHVVDGDTLVLHIDLGFDVWVSKRIRLRAIDSPELSTPQGKLAKEFVEGELKDCKMVVIQTFKKIDIYGRYVCDLFYLPGESDKERVVREGKFLNQQLLEANLAELI